MTGALLVTPFLILWFEYPRVKVRQLPAILLSLVFVFLTGQAVFGGWFFPASRDMHLEILCIPSLIWVAYRFGLRETATASILLCGVILWNTIHGRGPFVSASSNNQSLLLIQVFMGVISMTSLCLAAAITERKTVEENLEKSRKTEKNLMEELLRSNDELQQFANVASHDLQEPLRMVASYVQLLEVHLKGRLDQDAREYMGFAVDGAKRMQLLVNGLLEYSRVGSRGKEPQRVDMNDVFKQTVSNLEILILETGAKINHGNLPLVMGDSVQLTQLIQNLFSNALKFQKSGVPEIDFSAREGENEWIFACKDNGIGIDPKYFDRIFLIFQRLHHRNEYSGTGIGLAICKRIVERHSGRIWVDSKPDGGTTFFFTLPKNV